VVLVLLIIFMVVTPMLQNGVDVQLRPRQAPGFAAGREEPGHHLDQVRPNSDDQARVFFGGDWQSRTNYEALTRSWPNWHERSRAGRS